MIPLIAVTAGNKLLAPVIWGLESSGSHYKFSLSHSLKSLPDLVWWFFSYFDQSPSGLLKSTVTLILLLSSPLLIVSKSTQLRAAGYWLALALLISIPYAGITTYDYMYPRFSYPFGMFFSVSLAYLCSYLTSKFKLKLIGPLSFIVIFFSVSWVTRVLIPIPELKIYIASFYTGLDKMQNNIPSNSLVPIIVFRPDNKIIYLFDNFEYIEWAHSIIGYSRLAGLENRNIHFIILNNQEDMSENILQIKLRGHYGIRFGDGCNGMNNMKKNLKLNNIYPLTYRANILSFSENENINCDSQSNL